MKLKLIKEGIYMKGYNELRLSQDAIDEAVEKYFNHEIAIKDEHKITVDKVKYNAKTKQFIVLFHQKTPAK